MIDRRTLTRRTEEQLLQDFDGVGLEQIKMKNLVNTMFREVEEAGTPYVHPTGDGWNHIPATGTGSAGKVLTAGATPESAAWVTPIEGFENYAELDGIGPAFTVTIPAQITGLRPGFSIFLKAISANSQVNETLTVNGFGPYPIREAYNNTTLNRSRKWGVGALLHLIFDGQYWRLMGVEPNATTAVFGRLRVATTQEVWEGNVNAFDPAAVTPNDLNMAILRGKFIYAEDISDDPALVDIRFRGPPSGEGSWRVAGCCIHVKIKNTTVGYTQVRLTADGPTVPIVDRTGANIDAGAMLAGEIVTLIYNGQRWQLMGA